MPNKPKIFTFCATHDGSEGPGYALAEDGTLVVKMWSTGESHAKGALQHKPEYTRKYPQGFDLEFVPCKELDTHKGLLAARKLNDDNAKFS